MDKRRSLLALLVTLALAGCGGQAIPTATSVPVQVTATTATASTDTTISPTSTSPAADAATATAPVMAAATATQGSSSGAAPVEIKFVGMAGGVSGYQARADEFMKIHPDIKVIVEGIPGNSWGEVLQGIEVNIAAGDIPDIADIASEGQRTFADSGLIVPIDDYLARDQAELKDTLSDINPNLLNALKIDGKTYGLPTVWNNMAIYYNKKVLADAGLQPPKDDWTIDDFISMSQQVVAKNTGGADDKWGYAFANQYFLTLVPWMLANGGNVLTDDWTASRLQDPNTIAAVQMLHDFVHKYKISPAIDAGVADTDLFVQNKLAFMGAGMWNVNTLKLAKFNPDDYDVVPFPHGKGDKTVIGIGAAPIFAASQHKEAAWEFAKYLSSKDFQENFVVADGWSIPAVKSAADKLLTTPGFPKNGSIFYASADTGVLVPAPSAYGQIEEAVTRAFGAAMSDSTSVADAMASADKDVTAALASQTKK